MNGRMALTRITELIGRNAPRSDSLPAFEPLPRAGQLVLIGDFLSPLDAVNAAITRFAAAGLKGHMLQINDPAEEDLPFDGRIRFEGAEEPQEVVVSRVETIRHAYSDRFRRHRDGSPRPPGPDGPRPRRPRRPLRRRWRRPPARPGRRR